MGRSSVTNSFCESRGQRRLETKSWENEKSVAVQFLLNTATFRHITLTPFQQLEFSHRSHYSYSNAKVKPFLFSPPNIISFFSLVYVCISFSWCAQEMLRLWNKGLLEYFISPSRNHIAAAPEGRSHWHKWLTKSLAWNTRRYFDRQKKVSGTLAANTIKISVKRVREEGPKGRLHIAIKF